MKKNIIFYSLFLLLPSLQSCQRLTQDKAIEVISMKRVFDAKAPDHEICSSLTLSKENVETYFFTANEVDETEFHDEALILPCKYQGTIRIHGDELHWEIFAGGAGYLYNKNTVNKRYRCKKNCCVALPNLC